MATRWQTLFLLTAMTLSPCEPASAQANAKPDLVVALAIDQFGSLLFDNGGPPTGAASGA